MSEPKFLLNGDVPGRATLLLAHGAGAAMDTPFMTAMAEGLAARGLRVVRFEFAYMAGRRSGGPKRPPPKVELLQEEFRTAIEAIACGGPLFIGGKSMGGRVASLIADDLWVQNRIRGLVCLGYPFHPPNKPEQLRTAHLAENPGADLPGHPRPVRHPGRGRVLCLVRCGLVFLAERRRPRPEAAQKGDRANAGPAPGDCG